MRFLLGVLVGILITIIGVYIADFGANDADQKHMVNWDVVGERLSDLTAGARRVWADFTREITGPP